MLLFAGILFRVLRRKKTWWLAGCLAVAGGLLSACGENMPLLSPALSLERALVSPAQMLEYEPLNARQTLWEELLAQAQEQALGTSHVQPLFTLFTSTGFVAKEGPAVLDNCFDESPDLTLKLDGRKEAWSDTPREDWRGLSESDMARCLASALLTQWGIQGEVSLQKVAKSPYAAAYVEGSLRLNPSFVSLSAASF
jgi:hypothetical protein